MALGNYRGVYVRAPNPPPPLPTYAIRSSKFLPCTVGPNDNMTALSGLWGGFIFAAAGTFCCLLLTFHEQSTVFYPHFNEELPIHNA